MKIGKGCNIHPTVQIFGSDAIEIGDNTRIDAFCVLSGGSGLKIGSHVHIGCGSYLFAGSGIELEDFAEVSVQCVLHSDSDDWSGESLVGPQVPSEFKPGVKHGKIVMKRHSLLGARCTVLPGVTLNEGAAVGAHSLVKRDAPAWTISAGNPARVVRSRSRKMEELERQFLIQRYADKWLGSIE